MVLQSGDTMKVMVLSHNRERGHFYKETRIYPCKHDPQFNSHAEEMTQTFRQRIAQAEAMACADMLKFQHENGLILSSDRILDGLAGCLLGPGRLVAVWGPLGRTVGAGGVLELLVGLCGPMGCAGDDPKAPKGAVRDILPHWI
ncbi:hypothetical protein GQ457_01G012120 [Hibiscus cannabinus]